MSTPLYSNPLLSRFSLVDESTIKCELCADEGRKRSLFKRDPKMSGNLLRHVRDQHPQFVAISTNVQAEFEDTLGRLALRGKLSMGVVEEKDFVSLVSRLSPRLRPPSRHLLSYVIVPRCAAAALDGPARLVTGRPIAITTNGWQSRVEGVALFALTGHVITYDWDLHEVLLAARPLSEGESLQDILAENEIQPWIGVSSPSEALVVEEAGLESLVCPAHLMDDAVRSSLALPSVVSELLERVKAIAEILHCNADARHGLHDALVGRGRIPRGIPRDVATRWNSTYHMLEAVEKQVDSINIMAPFMRVSLFTAEDKELLGALARILFLPFSFTQAVTRRASTASEILPLFTLVFARLQSLMEGEVGAAREFATSLLEEVESRYESHVAHKESLHSALLLDARYSFDEALFPAQKWNEIKEDFLRRFDSSPHASSPPPPSVPPPALPSPSFKSLFDDLRMKRTLTPSPSRTRPLSSSMRDELLSFSQSLCQGRPDSESPVTEWWKENCHRFPLLSPIARRLLSTPSTSISSERVFSSIPSCNKRRELSLLFTVNELAEPRAMKAERVRPLRLRPLREGHVKTKEDEEETSDEEDEEITFSCNEASPGQEYIKEEPLEEEEVQVKEEVVEDRECRKRKDSPLFAFAFETQIKRGSN